MNQRTANVVFSAVLGAIVDAGQPVPMDVIRASMRIMGASEDDWNRLGDYLIDSGYIDMHKAPDGTVLITPTDKGRAVAADSCNWPNDPARQRMAVAESFERNVKGDGASN